MAITEKYANFGLTTGANDGTSETDAWKTPADIVEAAGERVNVKTTGGRYTLTAGWAVSANGSSTQPIFICGYTSTIGDGGFCQMDTGTGFNNLNFSGNNIIVENMDLTGAGALSQVAISITSRGGLLSNSKVVKTTSGTYTGKVLNIADSSAANVYVESAGDSSSIPAVYAYRSNFVNSAVKCTGGAGAVDFDCNFRANAINGVLTYSTTSTTNAGIKVSNFGANAGSLINAFTIDGFDEGLLFVVMDDPPASQALVSNGIISGAVDGVLTDDASIVTGCSLTDIAFYNNTNNYSDMGDNIVINPILCTADPYEDSANGDFRPNDTASGGVLLQALARFSAGIYTNGRDIGALQHADPSGGGGLLIHPGMNGGING